MATTAAKIHFCIVGCGKRTYGNPADGRCSKCRERDSKRVCKIPDCSARTTTNRRHYCPAHQTDADARRNERRRLERLARDYEPGKSQMEPRNKACPQCGKRGVKIDADGKYRICLSCGWNHYVMEEWE